MTLAEWKRSLAVGKQMRCTYRWYWKEPRTQPEIITIRKVAATYMQYDGCPNLKPNQFAWQHFPKASDLKATESGYELYEKGKLLSVYEYIKEPAA